jgi:hypothetical protein
MKTFIFHWKDGKSEELMGDDVANALNRAGYGGGALGALDYYEIKRDIKKARKP